MSITIDYYFSYPKSFNETLQDINAWIGCKLEPYQGDPSDLYCRFLGMELSFGKHTLENDRELNFEDFKYEIGIKTPAPDGDFRPLQLPVMAFLVYTLYRRLGITGILVFDVQILLVRYTERLQPATQKKALFDEVSQTFTTYPNHLLELSNQLPERFKRHVVNDGSNSNNIPILASSSNIQLYQDNIPDKKR